MTSGRWSQRGSRWWSRPRSLFWKCPLLIAVGLAVVVAGAGTGWAQREQGYPIQQAFKNAQERKAAAAAQVAAGDWKRRVDDAWQDFIKSWWAFKEWKLLLALLVALLLAVVLAALIAYHPSSYGKAQSLTEMEAPKTYIIYAIVGAVCGRLLAIEPMIGMALFGLGGLMRFRTDVGATKDTGRVIMVTVVGLCCGYNQPAVAVFATLLTWIFIYLMERNVVYRLMIKGLPKERLVQAEKAYSELLEERDCRIISSKTNFVKVQFSITFRGKRGLDTDDIEAAISESIPAELQGAVEWQTR